jgi:hypothetical protein
MINWNLVDKGSKPSDIKDLIHDLTVKKYTFRIIPEKIIHMNNGIKYYYVEAEYYDSKVIINTYGRQADELFKEVHNHSFLKNNISQ